jgi:hypothetical protein
MATRLSESRVDHNGEALPKGVYALVNPQGEVVSYKDRWREHDENGVERQRSQSFSPRQFRSLDKARAAAIKHREEALEIVKAGDTVLRAEKAATLTIGELFKEWIANHAAHNTGERYARDSIRTWDKHIEPRLGRVKLGAPASDPGIIIRFHEDLQDAKLAISVRRSSLALLRSVLRWGRRRYPRALTADVSGLFQVPSYKRRRLIRAADPIAVERIIEAVLTRRHRDPLGPIRDAALVAAMGFTVSARPSEWLVSATWADVGKQTVQLQAVQNELGENSEVEVGLKTGARVALLLPNAYDRLMAYREALESRHGEQPDNALVFQVLSKDGPSGTRTASRSSGRRIITTAGPPGCGAPREKWRRRRPTPRTGSAPRSLHERRATAASTPPTPRATGTAPSQHERRSRAGEPKARPRQPTAKPPHCGTRTPSALGCTRATSGPERENRTHPLPVGAALRDERA